MGIEEPFSILPLEAICRTVEGNVREMVATHNSRLARRAQQAGPAAPAGHAAPTPAELLAAVRGAPAYGLAVHGTNGHANGHLAVYGAPTNGHAANGHAANGHATNGHSNGHTNGHTNGHANGYPAGATILLPPPQH